MMDRDRAVFVARLPVQVLYNDCGIAVRQLDAQTLTDCFAGFRQRGKCEQQGGRL